jgi:hypothetical protein
MAVVTRIYPVVSCHPDSSGGQTIRFLPSGRAIEVDI